MNKNKKVRKVIMLDPPLSFLRELNRSGLLINKILKKVFNRPSHKENLLLALEILDDQKEVQIITDSNEINEIIERVGDEKTSKPQKSSLLNNLSKIAKDFGGDG